MRQVTEKLLKLEKEYKDRFNSLKNEIKFKKEAIQYLIVELQTVEEAILHITKSLEAQNDVLEVKNQILKEKEETRQDQENLRKAMNNKTKSKLSIIFKGAGWASQDLKREKERRSLNQAF